MGSKNEEVADASSKTLANKSPDPIPKKEEKPLPCEKPPEKHWIGVRVEDEDGKLVKDVTVHLKLPDKSEMDVDMATAVLGADGAFRTPKTYDPGTCDFSFPAVFNIEWWPKGGKAADEPATQSSTVADGDCTVSIAEALLFREYHSIWDRAENAELKKKRQTANHLTKDDVVKAPEKKDKIETKAMDQVWIFVVKKRKPAKLRMVLTDRDGKPLDKRSWELKSPVVKSGKTGPTGLVEIEDLPGKYKDAKVSITIKDAITAPVKPPAAVVPDPPPYPPPIVPADFKDKTDPPPDLKAKVVDLDLKIGSLESFDLKPGILARLHSLGFGCDTDSDEAHTTRAVKAYQKWFLKIDKGSGKPEDVQDDVRTRHDKL